jgi:hypothetical protein
MNGVEVPEVAPTPWRRIVQLALLGTLAVTMVVLWDVSRTGAHPVNLLQAGQDGPAAAVIARDFPDVELPAGLGLDGQQFYAMATAPWPSADNVGALDRPAYRWQRPLVVWLARVVHPQGGGGAGLVAAFFLIGVAATFGGAMAAGALSTALGGPPWPALLFPVLPGAYMSLRVTVADTLALALALGALALAARTRPYAAVLVGCCAVLAKETALVLLIGWLLARRRRDDFTLALVPMLVAAAWGLWLRATLPAPPSHTPSELGWPLVGLGRAARDLWLSGTNVLGMVSTLGALGLSAAALRKMGPRHRLTPAIVANLALVAVMNKGVVGIDFGATRSTMPLLALALIGIATTQRRIEASAPKHGAAGIVGPGETSGAASNRYTSTLAPMSSTGQ